MTRFKKLLFEIQLFLGIKKPSSQLLSLYRGEQNKPYAFWFNAIVTKAEELVKPKTASKPKDNRFNRMKEIIHNLEKNDVMAKERKEKYKDTGIINFDTDAFSKIWDESKANAEEVKNSDWYKTHLKNQEELTKEFLKKYTNGGDR